MQGNYGVRGTFGFGKLSIAFGTAIVRTIPPKVNSYTRLSRFKYTAAGTAHLMTVMIPYSNTTLSAAANASQAVINLTANPGTGTAAGAIAANDYLVIEKPDGTFHTAVVSSVNTLAVTLTADVPTGGFESGAKVWFFGAPGDQTDRQFDLTASATTTESDELAGLVCTTGKYEPMLLYSNNATATGTLNACSGIYSVN